MAWAEKDLNDHPLSTPVLRAGSPTTRLGRPEPHPAWPWTHPGIGIKKTDSSSPKEIIAHVKSNGLLNFSATEFYLTQYVNQPTQLESKLL